MIFNTANILNRLQTLSTEIEELKKGSLINEAFTKEEIRCANSDVRKLESQLKDALESNTVLQAEQTALRAKLKHIAELTFKFSDSYCQCMNGDDE